MRAAGKSSGSELKVNLLVSDERHGGGFYVDTVDLYAARQRVHYVKSATAELGADELELRREVGAVVLEVEAERRAAVAQASTPLDPVAAMTEDERVEALELLRDQSSASASSRTSAVPASWAKRRTSSSATSPPPAASSRSPSRS
ncbi:MAG: hypothetical protein IPG04_09425 [Polyangiaceae bacterium]|nr:hypothetical protein [Polyangiaceae bacterium]